MSSSADPAAVADPRQPLGADQREAFADHARRRRRSRRATSTRSRAIAGLLLQLARGRRLDALARVLVADQPGGQFEAARARAARDIARPAGRGRRRSRAITAARDAADARRHIPSARASSRRGTGPPRRSPRPRRVGHAHSSISRSGSSLVSPSVLGKCSASTAPICADRRGHAVAGRPSRTAATSAAIASPQTFGRHLGVDRGVGDDLGAVLVERQVEQHARSARGALLGADAEQLQRRARTRRALVAPGVSASRSGTRREQQPHDQERRPPSAPARSCNSAPAPAPRAQPSISRSADACRDRPATPRAAPAPAASPAPPSAARRRDRRPTARATTVTISPSVSRLGRGHRRGDHRVVGIAQRSAASPSPRGAAAPERSAAAAREAAAAPAAAAAADRRRRPAAEAPRRPPPDPSRPISLAIDHRIDRQHAAAVAAIALARAPRRASIDRMTKPRIIAQKISPTGKPPPPLARRAVRSLSNCGDRGVGPRLALPRGWRAAARSARRCRRSSPGHVAGLAGAASSGR